MMRINRLMAVDADWNGTLTMVRGRMASPRRCVAITAQNSEIVRGVNYLVALSDNHYSHSAAP